MIEIRAAITAAYNQKNYTTKTTYSVLEFFVDTALDTDTDSWQITLGDQGRNLIGLLHRDTEVRCNFHAEGEGMFEALHAGLADEIAWNDEGTMVINGRDFSCVAVDSRHPPQRYKAARPHVIVRNEAVKIGIGSSTKLTTTKPFKQLATDGSESYWQFWYRLYRKRQMWLWAEPDGSLIGSTLNYTQEPTYYFGNNFGLGSKYDRINFIPIETLEWRANKNQRVYEVYVIGNRGDKTAFVQRATDPSMTKWIRKPLAIVNSKSAHGPGEARGEALEELFESKVGATEITITVQNPGVIIRQNRMCYVNEPKSGVRGAFYVVGTKIIGSTSEGFVQQVRLRERNYAISKRVPTDPVLITAPGDVAMYGKPAPGGVGPPVVTGSIADTLNPLGDKNWGQYFVEATDKHHGSWPFGLYLGVLLSICEHESHFMNVRHPFGGPEYPGTADFHVPSIVTENAAYNKFVERFANDPKYGRIDHIEAVGPMQLYTQSYKEYADRLAGGPPDELVGGRWTPRYNIIAAGFALRSKLEGIEKVLDPGNAAQAYSLIWQGVTAYGASEQYMREIKKIYDQNYNEVVDNAISAGQAAAKGAAQSGWTFAVAQQATGGTGTQLGTPYVGTHNPASGAAGANWQSDNAYDIGVPVGTPIRAIGAGVVGPQIGIQPSRPNDGMRLTVGHYWYGHLSAISVKAGQTIKAGEIIGYSGKSQNGVPHLHVGFEGV